MRWGIVVDYGGQAGVGLVSVGLFYGWACYEDHADSEESKEVVPCRVTVREMLDLHRLAEYSAQSDKFLVPGVEQLFEVEPMDDEAAKAEIEAGEELMDDLFYEYRWL